MDLNGDCLWRLVAGDVPDNTPDNLYQELRVVLVVKKNKTMNGALNCNSVNTVFVRNLSIK